MSESPRTIIAVSSRTPQLDPAQVSPVVRIPRTGGRIGYIYQDAYPWEVRAEKFLATFAAAGHEVHVISRNRAELPRVERTPEHVAIHRLPSVFNGRLRPLTIPAFFSPLWFAAMWRVVRAARLELLIVRDLPLAPTALAVGRITGTPVLMDMAENYPAMIRDTWTFGAHGWLDYLIRNPRLLARLEASTLPRLQGVFVVSNASRLRVERLLPPASVPVWVVGNTPRVAAAARVEHPLAGEMRAWPDLKLLYVGGLEPTRGLDTAIRGLAQLRDRRLAVHLTVVGAGVGFSSLQRLIAHLRLEHMVHLAGWIDHASIPAIIAAADIGIIPHYVTEHSNTTIPNKIFDYMAQAKPVLATDCDSLVEIVTGARCGLIYRDRDPEDLAAAILQLSDPEMRSRLGRAGLHAVQTRYNWDVDARVLLGALRHFLPAEPAARAA